MRYAFPGRLALTGTLGLLAVPATAQVDTDLMARWSAVEVVHYVVVGEYAGESTILIGALGFRSTGKVTDRLEISFDWNQNETALVGTPVVRNGSSTVSLAPPAAGCPVPRVDGTYEHLDIRSVTPLANTLNLKGTRGLPAGAVPFKDDEGVCSAWDDAQAKSEDVEIMLLVLPTLYFAMPSAAGPGVSISGDGKSIVFVEQGTGWTWTYTPTPVR